MIVYFSGTGNSRYCAELLAERLSDELRDAFHFIKAGIQAELISNKPWVFVAPTYAWRLPHIFADFIKSSCFQGSGDAYFLLTCGSDIGDAASHIKELCLETSLKFKGVMPILMPENYVAMFGVPDEDESNSIIRAAVPVLEKASDIIAKGTDFSEIKAGIADRKKSGTINTFFYKHFVKAKDFYTTDGCIGCGKCVELCVLNNIELHNNRPVWGEKCTHCMACICYCPTEAIEYGKISKGKRRYKCPEYIK